MTIRFPRSAPSAPEFEESFDLGCWFHISNGLLISAVETYRRSRLLTAKSFNRRVREFSH